MATQATPQFLAPTESRTERYLRQIRNAVVTAVVVWLIGIVAGVIIGIVVAVNVANANTSTTNSVSSLCQSQGGPISGC